VVAETDLRVRVLPRREFDRAMRALPTLARIVREATVARLRPAAPFQPALAA
jgi:CRP-like cAMP-binding protein